MYQFVKLFQKSASGKIDGADFLEAARDLYSILLIASLAKGESWPLTPNFVCHLKEFVPMPVG